MSGLFSCRTVGAFSIGRGASTPSTRASTRDRWTLLQVGACLPQTRKVSLAGTHIFSLSQGSLIAQTFDVDCAEVRGEPVAVADQITSDTIRGDAFSAAANGVLAYRSASSDSELIWFDRSGRQIGLFPAEGDYHNPWLSPDERRLAVEKTDPATGNHTIWVLELARGVSSRLVFDGAGAHVPVWSPDGRRIVFSSNRLGGVDLYQIPADGTGVGEIVLSSSDRFPMTVTDWSLDGRLLLYHFERAGQTDAILPVSPLSKPHDFIQTPSSEREGQFSPDIQWVAYASNESGFWEVYVRRFPGGGGKWQVSTRGGAQPRWRRDGRELFYLAPDGKLMAVDVKASGATFETDTPRELFNTSITAFNRRNQYVVTGDGQRFLVNLSAEDRDSAPITVVLNWQSVLEK
jgi:dipeptidyl aminopeptidase/acylaminoacyl peptidase